MYAVRVDSGEKLWGTPAPEGAGNKAQVSAVAAMPGLAFSGSWAGTCVRIPPRPAKLSGTSMPCAILKTVNHVPAQGGSFNGGGPAIAGGMVVTMNGYGFVGGKPGNVLLAFTVDGK